MAHLRGLKRKDSSSGQNMLDIPNPTRSNLQNLFLIYKFVLSIVAPRIRDKSKKKISFFSFLSRKRFFYLPAVLFVKTNS